MIISGTKILAIPGKEQGFSRTEPLHTFEMQQDPMVLAPMSSACLLSVENL